jgi:hypothetical protein
MDGLHKVLQHQFPKAIETPWKAEGCSEKHKQLSYFKSTIITRRIFIIGS